jgi:hypothetical protein
LGQTGFENSQELKKKLSDFGVNYGSIATDDWDSDRIQGRKPSYRKEIYH